MLPHELTADADAPFARERATRRPETTAGTAHGPALDGVDDPGLIAHVVERHHGYERRALPYVVALLAKVAGCHRRRNAKLGVLCEAGEELAEALEAHWEDEERELFPALLADVSAPEAVQRGLDRMTRHHRALRMLLARIRWLADDFVVPPWGGLSYRALMEELAALEEDVLEHVRLEAHVLLPRLTSRCVEAC